MSESGVVRRAVVSALAASLCLLAAAGAAAAQIMYGSVVGVVKDAQGSLIPGATVTIVNRDTNLTRDTVTDAQGPTTS